MANALYDKYREDALSRAAGTSSPIDIDTDTIVIGLVKAGYTQNLATDQYFSTIGVNMPTASWRPTTGVTGVTVTAGVFNHSAKTLTAVASDSSNAATRIIYHKYVNATETNNPLIAYIDTATGLPVTPNGGDITITPDTGANKVFKI